MFMNVAPLYDWSEKIEAFLATWLGDGIVPAHCGAVYPGGIGKCSWNIRNDDPTADIGDFSRSSGSSS